MVLARSTVTSIPFSTLFFVSVMTFLVVSVPSVSVSLMVLVLVAMPFTTVSKVDVTELAISRTVSMVCLTVFLPSAAMLVTVLISFSTPFTS